MLYSVGWVMWDGHVNTDVGIDRLSGHATSRVAQQFESDHADQLGPLEPQSLT